MKRIFLFILVFLFLTMLAGCAGIQKLVQEPRVPELEIVRAVVCTEEPEGRKYTEHKGSILPDIKFWIYYEFKGLSISDAQTVHLKGEASISDESGILMRVSFLMKL